MTERLNSRLFISATDASTYALAGNATITLRSLATGQHYTYKVQRGEPRDGDARPAPHFVKLLVGPENTSDYAYLGMITGAQGFRLTKASKHSVESPAVKAFVFFYTQVIVAGRIPPTLEVRHEGSCGCCGRALTVPESIDRGIGPECAKRTGLGALPSPTRQPAAVVAAAKFVKRAAKPRDPIVEPTLNDDLPSWF